MKAKITLVTIVLRQPFNEGKNVTDTSKKQTQSLTAQFNCIMTKFAEMDQISAMRVDLKAKHGQELAVEAIKLTGEVIQTVEGLQQALAQLQGAANEES